MRMMRWSKATEENVEKRVRDGDGGKERVGRGTTTRKERTSNETVNIFNSKL